MVATSMIAAPTSAGEVLPSEESVCRERGGVQGPVPHVHRSRSPAVVWEDRTGRGMHRYENGPHISTQRSSVNVASEFK